MDNGGADLFEQWKTKQAAMGRTIPATLAPYSPPKSPPKRNVCLNREPEHLEKYTAAECDEAVNHDDS